MHWSLRQGILLALAPLLLSGVIGVYGSHPGHEVLAGGLSIAALLIGVALGPVRRRKGQRPPRPLLWFAPVVLALVSALLLAAPRLAPRPALTLLYLVLGMGALAALAEPAESGAGRQPWLLGPDHLRGRARVVAGAGLIHWMLVGGGVLDGPVPLASAAASLLLAQGLGLHWARSDARRPRAKALLMGVGLVCAVAAVGLAVAGQVRPALTLGALPLLPLLGLTRPVKMTTGGPWELILAHPARLLVVTFALLCLGGGVLLALPMSARGAPLPFVNALFTAVSAVCVTGLAVADTPTAFSHLGHWIILFLIQVGGLGIMTFSTAALELLGARLSLSHEAAVAELVGEEHRGRLLSALKLTLGMTFGCEAAGALILGGAFWWEGDTPLVALWRGFFTSISAFCNAGFALQSDSLVGYFDNPIVLHTVATLIIVGGMAPAIVLVAPRLLRGRRISLTARLAWIGTLGLLFGGFAAVLAIEWNGVLADMSLWERVHNAWFQSATLRTAGFNSVPMESLHPATQTVMTGIMFVGGSPGGTAGGIKTTTFLVLLLTVLSVLNGRRETTAFGRRLPQATLHRAAAVVTVAALGTAAAMVALQVTQTMDAHLAIFEVVSALATVGLTIGGTGELDVIGKLIIIGCMFVGRVGPLTGLLVLRTREGDFGGWFPEEPVDLS